MFRQTQKWTSAIAAVTVIVVATICVNTAHPQDKGFTPLFDGKSLDGWMTKGNWRVEKPGILSLKPRPGEKGWQRYDAYLWAKKKFGDFVLSLEYKHPKGGNSGVFVRVKNVKNPVNTGIEVQILDSYGHKGKLTHHDLGGVIRTSPPSKNMAKPPGKWNRMIVTCKGNNLKVKLNGERVIDIDLSKGPMKDRPAVGYIGIQDHGLPFWVRNVRIKELR